MNFLLKPKNVMQNIFLTIVLLVCFFFLSLFVEKVFDATSVISALFALAVFLVSLLTDGYFYGIAASLLSVLALNFAFTWPYFAFNFSIPENMVSAVSMLIITITASALTRKIQKQKNIEAESAREKMRANLLRAVSHDLRTPLTTIYGSSSLIMEQYDFLTAEQIQQLVGGVREDAQWLMGMVENLLSVTRIDSKGVKLRKTPTVLEELIDSVVIRFRKRYPKQKIVVDIPEEFISIPMDAMLIEQVLMNLMDNAVIHGVTTTNIKISAIAGTEFATIIVSNNGKSIDEKSIEHLFDGMLNVNESADKTRSMGIGLLVCKTIVEAHGGTIYALNLPSGGVSFVFTLKLGGESNYYQG